MVEPDGDRKEWLQFVEEIQQMLDGRTVEERKQALREALTEKQIKKLLAEPYFLFRDKQLEVLASDADTIMVKAGRGWGKNFCGAHWTLEQARRRPGAEIALVADSAADVRDYMVVGPSGIETLAPPDFEANYQSSKRRISFNNGAEAILFSAEKPGQLRGFSGEIVWWDEAAKSRYRAEVRDQIDFVLREGEHPQLLVTTTPKPYATIKELAEESHVIEGDTYENKANLSDRYIQKLKERYEGTTKGRQEIYGEIVDAAGDLWDWDDIEGAQLHRDAQDTLSDPEQEPKIIRLAIGLDPSVSDAAGDECGIVVVAKGSDGLAYVLEDLSGQYTTTEWGAIVTAAYQGKLNRTNEYLGRKHDISKRKYPWPPADIVPAETNQGKDLVVGQLQTYGIVNVGSIHAQRSKEARAEPVYSLYEQGKVRHVGSHPDLEEQMTEFLQEDTDTDSPDRVDALVHAIDTLLLDGIGDREISSYRL